jgi:hypothetical protein
VRRRYAALVALVLASACSRPAREITAPVDTGILRVASPVSSLLFARTQPTAVARTQDHKLRVLSWPDGKELRAIDYGDRRVVAFDLSADGASVALGDWSGLVTVWTTATGELRYERRLPKYPGVVTFSPDGSKLAVAPQGDAVRILDAATGAPVSTLGSPVGGTLTLAFSRDGRRVATGGRRHRRSHPRRDHRQGTGFEPRVPDGPPHRCVLRRRRLGLSRQRRQVRDHRSTRPQGKTTRKLDRTTQPMQALDVSPTAAPS